MESKWIAKSLTIWGGIVAALPGIFVILGMDGIDISALSAAGNAIINGTAVIGGLVMVGIGRVRANTGKQVTLTPK